MRPSRAVDGRPACCGSNQCQLCPVDSKGTALNTLYPAIRDRITLRTGLLATTLHCRGARVEAVTALAVDGGAHRIHARQFVVACNGVDSCLLLQRSPDVPKLPSLGRYFMDHPIILIAVYGSGTPARPGYGDSAQTGMFVPFFEHASADLPVSMLGEIRSGSLSEPSGALMRDRLIRELWTSAISAHDQASPLRARFTDAFRSTLDLWFMVEPQPMLQNTLSVARIEANGQAVPAIALRYPPYFAACVERVLSYVRAHIRQGEVRHVGSIPTAFHWLGTTRMASTPQDGCVDADLRYHALQNLFVLSTSVFPSASSANPTMTLAALALRLGDHLGARATA
jgi:choline dehydrogenase-like flavoprotein